MKTLTFRLIKDEEEIFRLNGRALNGIENIEKADDQIYLGCVKSKLKDWKFMQNLLSLRDGHYSTIQNIYNALLNLANHKKIDNYKILTEIN